MSSSFIRHLSRLLSTNYHPTTVGDVEQLLMKLTNAASADFYYPDGRNVRSDADAEKYIADRAVELRITFDPHN